MRALSRFVEGRLGAAIMGLLFVVLIFGSSAVGVAYGFGVFSHSTTVIARLPTAGPALGPGSEVEYRGVLVGSLGKLQREPTQAVLTMDIDPGQLTHIPADVTVRLVPRSVFGDLYVDLVPPATVSGHLQSGDVLAADTTTPSVELNEALDSGYELLTAIQPSKLSETLGSIATALDGRGQKLGDLVTELATYSAEVAPHTSQLIHDITAAGTLSQQIAANSANLFRVLDDSIALTSTIHQDEPSLVKLLNAGPVVATETNHLLAANRQRLNTLVHQLAPVIRILGNNEHNLDATVAGLKAFTVGAAKALGQGPYLSVTAALSTDVARGKQYTAADCPHYGGLYGPNCRHAAHKANADAAKTALVQALVNHISGADRTDPKKPNALQRLRQRLDIAKVLLTPVLQSVGGLLR
jgi:phospholipid/cholesterol/gamma-HCH transport system substrate-binding protein